MEISCWACASLSRDPPNRAISQKMCPSLALSIVRTRNGQCLICPIGGRLAAWVRVSISELYCRCLSLVLQAALIFGCSHDCFSCKSRKKYCTLILQLVYLFFLNCLPYIMTLLGMYHCKFNRYLHNGCSLRVKLWKLLELC